METSSAFLLIGVIITLAAILGAWAHFLKQPIFLAYILAGILVGPLIFRNGANVDLFNLLSDLGISFVLFLVGLDIKISDLKDYGKSATLAGLKQVGIVFVAALVLAKILGFGNVPALYIGIGLAFSSTIVAVKLLTEKRDFDSLYGQLTVTILLLQDFLAIFVLILIAGLGAASPSLLTLFITVFVGSVLFAVGYYLSKTLLPYIFDRIARSLELLFICSLAWLFVVSATASFAGFSIEIGAFLAGVSLANLPEEHQIAARIRPLRDFFILIFFILIGARIPLLELPEIIIPALLLAAFVIILKPLVTMFILSREGFRKRTNFMVGISIAQISEFSLVILFLGQKLGHLDQKIVSVMTLATLISIGVSSYLLSRGTKVYRSLGKYLDRFEPKKRIAIEHRRESEVSDHFVLIGAGRLGWDILKSLRRRNEKVLVVDFNPKLVEEFSDPEVPMVFGDITDPEILEEAKLNKAKLIISTIFDPEDSEELINFANESKVPVVVTAPTEQLAVEFYQQGASYVIIPRVISSRYFSNFLTDERVEEISSGKLREEQIELLSNRIKDRKDRVVAAR